MGEDPKYCIRNLLVKGLDIIPQTYTYALGSSFQNLTFISFLIATYILLVAG